MRQIHGRTFELYRMISQKSHRNRIVLVIEEKITFPPRTDAYS